MTEPKLRLQEGLDKLKKLDPETYETIYQMGFNKCHWPNYLIQGVIQDVIAAHSGWSIDFDGPHPWAINLWRCQISFGDSPPCHIIHKAAREVKPGGRLG
jgi:hypothetical protein